MVIPDDARELEPDRQAWLREVRRARWRARFRRLTVTRSGRPRPLALLATLLIAVLATTTALAGTVLSRPPSRGAPLAHPTTPAGEVNGLLPKVDLEARGGSLPSRTLRPAALLLLPSDCTCGALLQVVAGAAREVGVRAVAVQEPGTPAQNESTARAVFAAGLGLVTDSLGQLRGGLRPSAAGPRLILVRADGVITDVRDGPRLPKTTTGLDVAIAQLPRVPDPQQRP